MLPGFKVVCPAFLVVLIVAGVYASDENNPAADSLPTVHELTAQQDSVFSEINGEYQSVRPIFEHSCFDCHSQYTNYPWYHDISIVKGIMDGHIEEGLEYLDLSNDFPFDGEGTILEILEEIKEVIEEDEMPLMSYRMLHWGTLIEGEERDSVFKWIDNTTAALNDFYDEYGKK